MNKIYRIIFFAPIYYLLTKVISGPSVENIKILLLVANQSIFLFLYCYYANATGQKFVVILKFLRWLRIPDVLWIFIDDIKYYGRKPCFYYGFIVIDLTMNTFYWVRLNYFFLLSFFFCSVFYQKNGEINHYYFSFIFR